VTPGNVLNLDTFKLPHRGSKKNISKELIESVNCTQWIISTDGTQFKHSDAIAVSRIISFSGSRDTRLLFNVPSRYNKWWDNPDGKERYGYSTTYGKKENGLRLTFG